MGRHFLVFVIKSMALISWLTGAVALEANDVTQLVTSEEYINRPFNEKIELLDNYLTTISRDSNPVEWGIASSERLANLARQGKFEDAKTYLNAIEQDVKVTLAGTDHLVPALYIAGFVRIYSNDIEKSLMLIEDIRRHPDYASNPTYQQNADTLLVAIHTHTGNPILAAETLIAKVDDGRIEDLKPIDQLKLISNISNALVEGRAYRRAEEYVRLGRATLERFELENRLEPFESKRVRFHLNSNYAEMLIKEKRYTELIELLPILRADGADFGAPIYQNGVEYIEAAIAYGEGDLETAKLLISSVVADGKRLGAPDVLMNYLQLQAFILNDAGDAQGALEAYLEKQEVAESINAEQNRARTEYMNTRAVLQIQNEQIQRLEEQNKNAAQLRKREQFIYYLALIILFTVVTFTGVLLHSQIRLKAYARNLEKSEKSAQAAAQAKSAFLANMSHEIRTPLNGLLGMAQVLAQNCTTPEQRKSVDVITSSGNTLLTIVNDVLDLSKIEAGKMTVDPLPNTIRDIIDELTDLWRVKADEKGIELDVTISDAVPTVLLVDAVRLRQCISNLTSNAIKFTDQGSVALYVDWESKTRTLSVRVSDTGPGISADLSEKLFTAFQQGDSSTTRKVGGTGLGLVITNNFATLMGGSVSVENNENGGASFTLTLHAERAKVIEKYVGVVSADNIEPFERPLQKLTRILLVDDNTVNRLVAKAFLKDKADEIIEVENGQEALNYLLINREVDLILLDMHMPVLDGPSTVREIRNPQNSWSDIPVIALTADALEGDKERYLEMGVDGYLPKPLVQAELEKEIKRVLQVRAQRAYKQAVA